ncbi:MAG: NAD-binding protein [Candidatus Omnitrophica bacterium]|nr:NAD-binding protein [Candidatus Omnitrophota bacterium]
MQRFVKKIRRRPLNFIACLLVVIYIICIAIVIQSEKVNILDAVLILMPSIFGELGEIKATPRDITSIVSLVIYVCFLGLVIGKLSEVLINLALKGGVIVKQVNHEGHIVICGWNYQGEKIITSLLNSGFNCPVVILTDMDKVPYDSERVDFIQGCPWRKDDLLRANIEKAYAALVLTGLSLEEGKNPDSDALMITLAIKNINKNIHTCVQLHASENRIHLENAKADEIICLDRVGGELAVSSALNHGISSIIDELLTFNRGDEFYRYKKRIPEDYVGKSFVDIAKRLIDKNIILIAIETDEDDYVSKQFCGELVHSLSDKRVMVINPKGEYRFREDDSLFIIAKEEPAEL